MNSSEDKFSNIYFLIDVAKNQFYFGFCIFRSAQKSKIFLVHPRRGEAEARGLHIKRAERNGGRFTKRNEKISVSFIPIRVKKLSC